MKTHISLNVSNIENSVAFYKKMFNVEPVKIKTNYAKFDITNPPLNLTMNQTIVEKGGLLSHLGLQVNTTEEVLEMGNRWRETGLLTFDEMQTDCCYSFQDKIWITDPDGTRWEVFVVLGDSKDTTASNPACCVPSTIQISGRQ